MTILSPIHILFILFSASLLSIIIMIGRKLVLLEPKQISSEKEIVLRVPYLKEVKHLTVKNIKKHGYAGLVGMMRLYLKSANFLKSKYEEIKTKIKNKSKKNENSADKKEISKFLRIMGEYKQKIREIKHKIKKEENL